MTTHSKYFSPSSSRTWMRCAAAPKMQADIEEDSNPAADRGTRLHEIADECYRLYCSPFDIDVISREDAELIQYYLDYIRNIDAQVCYSEYRVDFNDFIESYEVADASGTCDFIAVNRYTIEIVDFKTGQEKVHANSSQLKTYALGAYATLGWLYTDLREFRLTIVQPTLDHIETYVMSREQVLGWGEEVREQSAKILSVDPEFRPGEIQCQYCKARAKCLPRKEFVYATVANEFDNSEELTLVDLNTMNEGQFTDAVKHAKMIKDWAESIQKEARYRLLKGDHIEGFKLVHGRGRRGWADEQKAYEFLIQNISEEECYTRKLISPAQAEKLIRDKKSIQKHVIKVEGALTMAPESDPRKAVYTDPASGFDELD